MKIGQYSVQDIKTGFFPPTAASNDDHAKRTFATMASNKDTQMHHYPNDYRLWRVGEFDSESGILTGIEPTFVCDLHQIFPIK